MKEVVDVDDDDVVDVGVGVDDDVEEKDPQGHWKQLPLLHINVYMYQVNRASKKNQNTSFLLHSPTLLLLDMSCDQ